MYTWLSDALGDSGTVVTANRRLVRALVEQYAADQLAAGKSAWRTPPILAWPDWLGALFDVALRPDDLPGRINTQQSQVIWERCLQKDSYEGSSLAALVRQCRETRQRLADWQVPIRDVARTALSEDHRVFASVLGRYLGVLERENWIDDAGLGALILQLLSEQRIEISGHYTFAGFSRLSPLLSAVHDAIEAAGVKLTVAPVSTPLKPCTVHSFDTSAVELRSAGAWARTQIRQHPDARIAIVVNDLDQNADIIARYVRDGATPGWQHGHASLFDAINVSRGRRLADYPAVAVALLLLRWLVDELASRDVSLLLRTPLLGVGELPGRSRLELRLRQLPDRRWTPSMVTAELRGKGDSENVSSWLANLAAFSKQRRDLPKAATPANWVVLFDQVLRSFLWPGRGSLESDEYQLINRWRELLNEFARLGLVNTTMSARAAIGRLESMAGEAIFQPETVAASIQLLGPLEASGLRFDGIWVAGVTTTNWPPAGTPSVLVSRRLQEQRGMPDCTPADTLLNAKQVLGGLVASGEQVICSYALHDDDAEQSLSDLLLPSSFPTSPAFLESDLYAASLLNRTEAVVVDDDVPPITAGEKISAGAATIQNQIRDPVSAFISGRMGARVISPQAVGIPAPTRGKLIHDALHNLYFDLPTSDVIRGWRGADLGTRIKAALNSAFARHERNTDAVLQQLLLLERSRIAELLHQFVALDADRGEFQVLAVEGKYEFVSGHIRLPLRFDRVDGFADGNIAILDYKTGAAKYLLNKAGEVQEIQLFVYAAAAEATVSALALVNVDTREIVIDGVGRGYTDPDAWTDLLQRATEKVAVACHDMSAGDVRIDIEQGVVAARALNLLTRYTELRHDNE